MRVTFKIGFLLLLLGCSSLPDPHSLDEEERTKISVRLLKQGKARYDEIMADPDHRAEDFEEVIQIWKEGLRYQPKNTLILRDMAILLYNMGRAYINRKQTYLALAEELQKQGKVEEAKKQEELAQDAEKKARHCFQRTLYSLTLLLQNRKPHSPAEERLFFVYMVTSHIYLEQFKEALDLVEARLESLPDDDPEVEKLMEMREAIVRAMRASE